MLRALERARLLRLIFRLYERATTLSTARRRVPRSDGLPLPPAHLRTLAAGTADPAWFVESGRLSADLIGQASARHGLPLASVSRLLDFGCGCGRILRHWQRLPASVEVHATEPHPRLADWCARNLQFARVLQSSPLPPLPYESGSFDFVYAVSVFTHLAERAQLAWMEELARILRPAGLLLLTLHGDRYRDRLTPTERRAYEDGRVVVRRPAASGTNLCSVFHPPAYVRRQLSAGFDLLELATGAFERATPEQDLVLLRKCAPSAA